MRQNPVGEPIGALFLLTPALRHQHRDRCYPRSWSSGSASVPRQEITLLVDQRRHRPAPSADRGGELVEIGLAMPPGIVGIRDRRERQWVTAELPPGQTWTPLMRIYIIGSDGIMLCRKAPATLNDGGIAVASNEELHA
jgi:hypothetical protein